MTQWIKCSERLPEKDGRYLVYEKQCKILYNWTGVSSLRNGKFDDEAATHWQPLPEAPGDE